MYQYVSMYSLLSNIPYILFIHSPVDEHLDCFQFGVIMYNAVMNIWIQAFVDIGFHFFWGNTYEWNC